jgi:hypothetical protein
MAKLAYENDIIAALGPISGMHKLLYLTLWSRANEIGHIMVNLDDILGLTGIRFQHEDLTHFGDRLVMVDKNEAILSRYLLTTIGTFSKGMRGQKKMWDLLKIRWGATKDDITPFMEGWKKLGILKYAPQFPGEYTGEENLPDWLVAHRRELEKVSSMDTPFGWPPEVAKAFREFILYRVKLAREQTSRSLARDYRITPDQVILFQEMVQEMIYNGIKESKIVGQIRYPIANNKKSFYSP